MKHRVETLESRVEKYENAQEYFDSILDSERVWWSTLVLVITALIGVISYSEIKNEVDSVSEEIEEFREEFNRLEDDYLVSRSQLLLAYANRKADMNEHFNAFYNRILAVNSLSKVSELNESRRRLIIDSIETSIHNINSAIYRGEVDSDDRYSEVIQMISTIMSESAIEIDDELLEAYDKLEEIEVEGDNTNGRSAETQDEV